MSRNSFSFPGFQGKLGEVRPRQSLPPDAPGLKETFMFWPQGDGRVHLFENPHTFNPILGQG